MTGRTRPILILALAAVLVLVPACSDGGTSAPADTPTPVPPTPSPTVMQAVPTAVPDPTSTPTPATQSGAPPTPEPPESPCAGLSGQIEVQVLVGPAEAVGLEPVAVGSVPFNVATDEAPFVVQGGGGISYADVLVEEWGTYEVTLDLATTISGECLAQGDSPTLDLVLEMTGQQLVEVEAEGFQGEYPWSGSKSIDLAFPVVEGATAQGEGWVMVLHLSGA